MFLADPQCAQNVGSWCERIWSLWSVEWLATTADRVLTPALRILVILLVVLIARALINRLIGRLTSLSAQGFVPGSWKPWRDRAESRLLGETSVNRRRERSESVGSLLKSISAFIIVIVTVILILAELGINVAPLLASAGIAGIAVGFGAQNLVRDFLAGISMILEDQYGVGDSVDLGPAAGTVLAVGLRTTTVLGADGTIWYVRNGEVLRVGNSSQGEAVVNIDLPLTYAVDADRAGEIALAQNKAIAETEEFADCVTSPPELQGITSMAADSVVIRVASTVRAGSQAAYARAVRTAIKAAYADAGINSAAVTPAAPPAG